MLVVAWLGGLWCESLVFILSCGVLVTWVCAGLMGLCVYCWSLRDGVYCDLLGYLHGDLLVCWLMS
jgi:hypothetical protein